MLGQSDEGKDKNPLLTDKNPSKGEVSDKQNVVCQVLISVMVLALRKLGWQKVVCTMFMGFRG